MAKYTEREMPIVNGKGGTRYYYTLDIVQCLTQKAFVKHLCDHYGNYDPGTVQAVLSLVAEEMACQMAQGNSVTLDGIGVFRAKLGVRKDVEDASDAPATEAGHRNARTIAVRDILFRTNKKLVQKTAEQCRLQRGRVSNVVRVTTTLEERLAKLKAYLADETHPFVHIDDYCALTGMSKFKAGGELKAFARDPESGVKVQGRGPAKVYVLGRRD